MSTPAEVIYQLMLDLQLGVTGEESGDWKMYIGFFPDDPHEAICIYDTAGKPDGRIMFSGEKIEHPGFQIRVRGRDYPVVWAKVNEIAQALDLQRRISVVISSEEMYLVHSISRTGTPIPLGVEEIGDSRRHHFTINAVMTLSNDDEDFLVTEDGDYRILE